jgi:hypothetical protein
MVDIEAVILALNTEGFSLHFFTAFDFITQVFQKIGVNDLQARVQDLELHMGQGVFFLFFSCHIIKLDF